MAFVFSSFTKYLLEGELANNSFLRRKTALTRNVFKDYATWKQIKAPLFLKISLIFPSIARVCERSTSNIAT